MVEQTHVVQRASKARGQDVHSTATARNQPAQTYPLQLALFQTFFSDKNPSDDATAAESYSNTIELYDGSRTRRLRIMFRDLSQAVCVV